MSSFGERMKFLLIAVVLLACFGCREPVTWSTELRSPDGTWTATAKTIEHGGFGTGGVETIVSIKRSNGSGPPERVLAFAEAGPDMDLKMQWEGPSHLLVAYKANPSLLYFQVVKTSGVDISAQNLAPKPQEGFQPSARP